MNSLDREIMDRRSKSGLNIIQVVLSLWLNLLSNHIYYLRAFFTNTGSPFCHFSHTIFARISLMKEAQIDQGGLGSLGGKIPKKGRA